MQKRSASEQAVQPPLCDINLLQLVLGHLSLRQLAAAAAVCQSWGEASKGDAVWKPLTLRRFPEAAALQGVAGYKALCSRLSNAEAILAVLALGRWLR